MKLWIRTKAYADISEALKYYQPINPQLARGFLSEIDSLISTILDHPKAFQVLVKGVRRAPMRRFPYGIFYRVDDAEVVVLAVSHLRRDPSDTEFSGE